MKQDILNEQFVDTRLQKFLPVTYAVYEDRENKEYVVVREMLTNAEIMTDYTDISNWDDATIKMALRDFSEFHSFYYQHTDDIAKKYWMLKPIVMQDMLNYKDVWQAFLDANKKYSEDFILGATRSRIHLAGESPVVEDVTSITT